MANRFIYHIPIAVAIVLTSVSCSTTRRLPDGEQLYTGLKGIYYKDKDSANVDDDLLGEIEEALAARPNNAFMGSSSLRTPFPTGLWIYNANVGRNGRLNRWMMSRMAARPVLLSAVDPDTRVKIVRNLLRANGYFAGDAEYEIIAGKHDPKKAQIRYTVTFNTPYTIDSIEYRRIGRIDTLFDKYIADRLVRKGDVFTTARLEAERQRLATLLRNNGYYYFRAEYLVFRADSSLSSGKINLRMGLKQGVPASVMRSWKTGAITARISGYDNEQPTDSIRYNGMLIRYEGRLRIRPSALYEQIRFKSGELYSQEKQTATQAAINRLAVFRYVDVRYFPKDTTQTCDTMNVLLNLSYDYPLNGTFDVQAAASDNDYAGPKASLNFTRQNIFGGGEALTASVYGSYELYAGSSAKEHTGTIDNYLAGVNATLHFPSLVRPHLSRRSVASRSFSTASTQATLDASVLNRAGFYRTMILGASLSYDFVPNPIRRHTFTPLKITFNRLQATTSRFDAIADSIPSLLQSMQDQFIPAISYVYTLDNAAVREERSKTRWQLSVSEAGNLISGLYAVAGKSFGEQKQIMGNPFAQFLKIATELRYNQYIDRNRHLATRLSGGIIYSYGNSLTAPYNERFYAGGASSIRAFAIRSIGPGRFAPDVENPYTYMDQNGDLKLEGNIEYRHRLAGNLEGAVFVDAGNVWLLRDDPMRQGGTFRLNRLFNDIAVGTGVGLRYDASVLIFRLDMGYALHFPYDTGSKGYFNAPSFADAIGLHLALGYPF